MFGHNKTLVSLKSLVLICGGLNFFSSRTIIMIYVPLDAIIESTTNPESCDQYGMDIRAKSMATS